MAKRSPNFELTWLFCFFFNALWPCRSFSTDGKVICDRIFGRDKPSKSRILWRQAEVKTTRSALPSTLLSARYFPSFSLNISFKIRSTNESRRFSGNRHSGVAKKQSVL